jgi:hypothetical protein
LIVKRPRKIVSDPNPAIGIFWEGRWCAGKSKTCGLFFCLKIEKIKDENKLEEQQKKYIDKKTIEN